MLNVAWAPAALVFIAVALGTLSIVLVWEMIASGIRRKAVLERLKTRGLEDLLPQDTAAGILARQEAQTRLNAAMAAMPHFRDLPFLMRQAGVEWSASSYLLAMTGLALAFGMAGLFLTRMLVFGVMAAAFGGFLPYIQLRRKRKARLYTFEEQFPEAIDLIGRAIRAGHPLSSGIRMVGEEAPEPVAGEFRTVFEQQRFGIPFDDALIAMADRINLIDVRIMVTAILIQREVGGNLAEILDKIAMTIRARFTIRRQLRVYTAQGRLTGYVLAALPIVLATAIFFLDREYVKVLVDEPIGRLMVIVAIVLQVIGYLWIRKIVNIEI